MGTLLIFLLLEGLILVLSSYFCFKNTTEFSNCLYSFWYVGYHNSNQKHERQSLRFAIYFAIVLFTSILNIEYILNR